jgi:microcystin degradation protein MlrC
MIDTAEARGVTLVPSLAATASPAGRVSKEFYAEARDRLLADLQTAGPLDGVLLDLHGAMVVEGLDDGEGDLLQAVRAAVGPVPIAVTLDFHANVTRAMVDTATLLHGYKTYPHVDMDARGREAAARLADVAAARIRPTVAYRQLPMLPPIAGQLTTRGPMRRLYDLAPCVMCCYSLRPRCLPLETTLLGCQFLALRTRPSSSRRRLAGSSSSSRLPGVPPT